GHVAWRYALLHPEKLDALVLIDAAGWPDPRAGSDGQPLIFTLIRNPTIGPLIRDLENRPLVESALRAAFVNPTLVTPAMIDPYVELARAPGHRAILVSIDQGAFATPQTLAAIHAPTLVMQGAADLLVPPVNGERFADAIPGAKVVMFP